MKSGFCILVFLFTTAAMQLARMVQWHGAAKVFLILVDARLEVSHGT